MESRRTRMPIEQRAKIFLPFSGVRGLEEALEKKREERLREERVILSEDGESELDEALRKTEKGNRIRVYYYEGGRYLNITGVVSKKNEREGTLVMEDGTFVYFRDIHSIEILLDLN